MNNILHSHARHALAAAVLLAAAPAMADVITFDNLAPLALAGGDTLAEAGYTLAALDNPWALANGVSGLSGMILDGAVPAACEGIACPGGNAGHYYAGLNDGALRLSRGDGRAFSLTSLDFAFLAAQPVDPGLRGQLMVTGTRAGGASAMLALDLPAADGAGHFAFATSTLDALQGATFTSVTFSACVFLEGSCVNSVDAPAYNLAQFALDNIGTAVSAVPEPSTWTTLLTGLAIAGLVARRRRVRCAGLLRRSAAPVC